MPARPARRVPSVALALLALVAPACSHGTAGVGATTAPAGARTRPATAVTATALTANDLAVPLAAALKAHDRAAFLAFAAGSAQPAMANWWDNLDAIGFDTGAASGPTGDGSVTRLDAHGRGTVTLEIGVHSPLDPTRRDGDPIHTTRPSVPSTRYDLDVQLATVGRHPTITSWRPHDVVAPWDGPKLYVRKDRNVVVAGLESDAARVDAAVADAQAAAAWTIDFFHDRFEPLVRQAGFVVFVTTDPTTSAGWFPKPADLKGWFGDRTAAAFPLAGQAGKREGPGEAPIGGARVVVPGTQIGDGLRATLVHEFTHVLYAPDGRWHSPGGSTMPAWVPEGAARLVEATYVAHNPDAYYDTTAIRAQIQQCAQEDLLHDVPPSDAEVYGGGDRQSECAYDVSAALLASLGRTVDANNLWQSIQLAVVHDSAPWTYVVESTQGAAVRYHATAEMQLLALQNFHTFYGV
ncbi:MAG: hypothetical protein JWM89_2047 [Acidimicrobiales bacterium]|nr:hypothetical protein [Acidimicrobiales bacterium]